MANYARLENGVVVEFFETDQDISTLFHKDFIWVKLKKSDVVEIGDIQAGSAWVKPTQSTEDLALAERVWRGGELSRADVQIKKIEDSDSDGSIVDWRKYRVSLRNWPESTDFPDSSKRPVAPDATNQ